MAKSYADNCIASQCPIMAECVTCCGDEKPPCSKWVDEPAVSPTKSSQKLPALVDVLKMFNVWAKKKQDRDGNIHTLELIEAIYDFVAGNKKCRIKKGT